MTEAHRSFGSRSNSRSVEWPRPLRRLSGGCQSLSMKRAFWTIVLAALCVLALHTSVLYLVFPTADAVVVAA